MPDAGARPRNAARAVTTSLAALALVAGCGGVAAPPAASPTPAAAALAILEQQAFVDAPESWEILPAFGSIWVGGFIGTKDDGTVTRIDPSTNAVVATIKVSDATDGMAATDEGVWIVDGAARALRLIDPKTNTVTDRKLPIMDEGGDLLAANGSLWHLGWDVTTRIDPATGTATILPMLGGCGGGCGFAVTADAIYKIKDGSLYRFDIEGKKIQATNATDVAGTMVAVGPAGVYAGSSTAAVAILDPQTLVLKQAIGSDPVAGPDGGKWSLGNAGTSGAIVADDTGAWVRFSSAVLGRVDPAAGSITLYGGPFPSEADGASPFAVAEGSLWLTNEGAGSGGADGGKPGAYRVALPTP